MLLLSHPTGNNFSRALLAGLLEANRLGAFATCVAVKEADRLIHVLPRSLRRELLRRKFDVPTEMLVTRPWMELARLAASRAGLNFLTRNETGLCSWGAVFRDFDRFVAAQLPALATRKHLTAVYCYEDAAWHTFQSAKNLGLRTCYDLPIAYWETSQQLLREECERLPEWAVTIEGLRDSSEKLARKTRELEMADLVVCPSAFVLESLPEAIRNQKDCIIAKFGSPPPRTLRAAEQAETRRPLRILFAGSMSQRKGLADVFAAMKIVNRPDVELVVFGSPVAPMEFYKSRFPNFIHEPPRPHEEVLRLMESCDLLLLPSIVEGRALVQQEAMSCGLPLIITPNTGGADLVEEGETGFLVPIRSPEKIAEKIEWFAENRDALPSMRLRAQEKAALLAWKEYTRTIIGALP